MTQSTPRYVAPTPAGVETISAPSIPETSSASLTDIGAARGER